MSSGTGSSSPKNVTYLDTLYGIFEYPPKDSHRVPVTKITKNMTCRNTGGEEFYFEICDLPEKLVAIYCKRAGTPKETDGGYFLRLHISVLGIDEKPKVARLEHTETATCVNFDEDSFFPEKEHLNYIYVLKCVFRKIECTLLSNERRKEQERMWQAEVFTTCKTTTMRKDMSYVLNCPNLQGFFTGRKVDHEAKCRFVKRACSYSETLADYFWHKRKGGSLSGINLSNILGYIYNGEQKDITFNECLILYREANSVGLMFLKELATDYLIRNLRTSDDNGLRDILQLADATEDSPLFKATYDFCLDEERLFAVKWNDLALAIRNFKIPLAVILRLLFRSQNEGEDPVPIEEETTVKPDAVNPKKRDVKVLQDITNETA